MAMVVSSGTGVSGVIDRSQTVAGHVGVDLRRRHVGVAEELLHRPQVGASLEQVRSVGVAQRVRVEGAAVLRSMTVEDATSITRSEHPTTAIEEDRLVRGL